MASKAKFATQVDAELLATVRGLAAKEGRKLQALVDEALGDLVKKHTHGRPRPHVMGTYLASHERFAPLYKKLAE